MPDYLVVEQHDCLFALPQDSVVEVVSIPWISQRPGASAGVLGVVDYRGQIALVIDLVSRLGGPLTPISSTDPLILLQTEADQERVAVRVATVLDLIRGTAQPIPSSLQAPWRAPESLVWGTSSYSDRVVWHIDLLALLRAESPGGELPSVVEAERTLLLSRAQDLANPLVVQQQDLSHHLVVFQLAEERFALDVSAVAELTTGSTYVPVPGSPPHLLGLAYHRGGLLRLIDLRGQLGLSHVNFTHESVVILRGEGMLTGLAVDSIEGVTQRPVGLAEDSWNDGSGWIRRLELNRLQIWPKN